jgi:hypothetical protein
MAKKLEGIGWFLPKKYRLFQEERLEKANSFA